MVDRVPLWSPMIYRLRILQMPIGELSAELLQCSSRTSELRFQLHPAETLVSSDIDVFVTSANDRFQIRVAEPRPGRPVMDNSLNSMAPESQMGQLLIQATDERRALLEKLTEAIFARLPLVPQTGPGTRLAEQAQLCGVHVTTVSRTLDNKVCEMSSGPVQLKQLIDVSP